MSNPPKKPRYDPAPDSIQVADEIINEKLRKLANEDNAAKNNPENALVEKFDTLIGLMREMKTEMREVNTEIKKLCGRMDNLYSVRGPNKRDALLRVVKDEDLAMRLFQIPQYIPFVEEVAQVLNFAETADDINQTQVKLIGLRAALDQQFPVRTGEEFSRWENIVRYVLKLPQATSIINQWKLKSYLNYTTLYEQYYPVE